MDSLPHTREEAREDPEFARQNTDLARFERTVKAVRETLAQAEIELQRADLGIPTQHMRSARLSRMRTIAKKQFYTFCLSMISMGRTREMACFAEVEKSAWYNRHVGRWFDRHAL